MLENVQYVVTSWIQRSHVRQWECWLDCFWLVLPVYMYYELLLALRLTCKICACRSSQQLLLLLVLMGMITLMSHTTIPLRTVSSASTPTRQLQEATQPSSAARFPRLALRTCSLTPPLAARKYCDKHNPPPLPPPLPLWGMHHSLLCCPG